MEDFEQKLKRLEELSVAIKKSDVTLEEALKDFEEGIKLAKGLEKELDAIESKIQILTGEGGAQEEPTHSADKASSSGPTLELFSDNSEINGTRNS